MVDISYEDAVKEPTWSVDTTARYFGVSIWTIRDWHRKGKLRGYLTHATHGKLRFRRGIALSHERELMAAGKR